MFHRLTAHAGALVGLAAMLLTASVAVARGGEESAAPAEAPAEASASSSTPAPTSPPPAPVDDEYERHMANGVKLFGDEDYNGAIVEFQAAYDAQPRASPLINIALAYKRLREPAKAIAALERALGGHQDTMPPDQKLAAELEIRELRALVAYVAIDVSPPTAQVFVDDRPVPRDDLVDGMLELSPGVRVVRAAATGYVGEERTVTIRSGAGNAKITLKLQPTLGTLVVVATNPDSTIEIDGKPRGRGRFSASLSPGLHVVRIIARGGETRRLDVVVAAGGRAEVTQDPRSGALESPAAAPARRPTLPRPEPDPRPVDPEPRALRGPYIQGSGSLITVIPLEGSDRNFEAETGPGRFGGSGGLNLGYRVTDWAGFELFGQVSDIRMQGSIAVTDPQVLADRRVQRFVPQVQMKLTSVRFGGMMRVMLPTRGIIRFVGNVGAGAAYDELRFREGRDAEGFPLELPPPFNAEFTRGWEFFAQVDLGVELEIENIIVDVVAMNVFQSSKHLDAENTFNGQRRVFNAFNTAPFLITGPAVRLGYGFW
ncbi:MAG: hypothetical protein AAGN82_14240 [Myxococcota bacterium]